MISFDELSEMLPDPHPNALEEIIEKESHIETLQKALQSDIKGFNILLLKQYYTTQEIAQIHNKSVSNINYHIRKVRKELSE